MGCPSPPLYAPRWMAWRFKPLLSPLSHIGSEMTVFTRSSDKSSLEAIASILLIRTNFIPSNPSLVPDSPSTRIAPLPLRMRTLDMDMARCSASPRNTVRHCLESRNSSPRTAGCWVPCACVGSCSAVRSPCANWLAPRPWLWAWEPHWLFTHLTWQAAFWAPTGMPGTDPHLKLPAGL